MIVSFPLIVLFHLVVSFFHHTWKSTCQTKYLLVTDYQTGWHRFLLAIDVSNSPSTKQLVPFRMSGSTLTLGAICLPTPDLSNLNSSQVGPSKRGLIFTVPYPESFFAWFLYNFWTTSTKAESVNGYSLFPLRQICLQICLVARVFNPGLYFLHCENSIYLYIIMQTLHGRSDCPIYSSAKNMTCWGFKNLSSSTFYRHFTRGK